MNPGQFQSYEEIPAVVARGTNGTAGIHASCETGGVAAKLEGQVQIDQGATNDLALQVSSSGAGWGSGIQLQNTAPTTGKTYGIYSGQDGKLHVSDEAQHADRLVIDQAGNVGVGGDRDPNSAAKLYVVGDIEATGTIKAGGVPGAGQAGSSKGPIQVDMGAANNLALQVSSSGAGWGSGMQFQNTAPTTGRTYGIYAGQEGTLHVSDETQHADRLTIDQTGNVDVTGNLGVTGNVGIGGARDPKSNAKLYVVGDIEATGTIKASGVPQGASQAATPSKGPVQIDMGTTNDLALQISSSGAGWGSGIQLQNTASKAGRNYGMYAGQEGVFHLADVTQGVDRLIIDKDGNVGIGGSPQSSAKLSVVGDIKATGTKNFVQSHPTDPTREIVYVALEGGEAGTYTRGTWKLDNGNAVIKLPEHFGLVTNEDGLTVQLTSRGEWLQLYVVSLSSEELIVQEAQGKSGQFDYFIQGVRKGYEHHEVVQERK